VSPAWPSFDFCSVLQIQTIEADSKCQELWDLLQWTRKQENMTIHDVIAYRREAEQHVGSDENLYRFEWVGCVCVKFRAELNLTLAYRIPD
jgi:histone deacetylase complex regulatory component SIN3